MNEEEFIFNRNYIFFEYDQEAEKDYLDMLTPNNSNIFLGGTFEDFEIG